MKLTRRYESTFLGKYESCFTILSLLVVAPLCYAEDTILLRPQAGIGEIDSAQYQHAGFRLLFSASDIKKAGLELTQINTAKGDYVAAGIVLEKKDGWLNLSIGSIGYFGQGAGMQNLPGLVANIGWEPQNKGPLKPFVTLRNDIIFGSKTLTGNSLSLGLAVEL
jgi:hypothetical protein